MNASLLAVPTPRELMAYNGHAGPSLDGRSKNKSLRTWQHVTRMIYNKRRIRHMQQCIDETACPHDIDTDTLDRRACNRRACNRAGAI